MKITEKYQKTNEYTRIVKVVCDMCKLEAPSPDYRDALWNEDPQFAILKTVVGMEDGSSYPEGGDKKTIFCDLCPKCFKERLMPWLRSQGVIFRVERSDW